MISIIIASAHNKALVQIKNNIAETIGAPYEILDFPNENGEYGITEIYNKGVAAAKYDLLCFMHEDIEIHTQNWGEIVVKHFNSNLNLGVLGIAGSDGKTSIPSGCHIVYGSYYMNLIQHYKFQETPPKRICLPENFDDSKELHQVVCVDGVWFCCSKQIAKKNPFDESLKGFHGYDIDFSIAVAQNYTNFVTFEILLSHYSEGNFSLKWLDAMIYIHNKYKNQLPIYTTNTSIPLKTKEKQTYKNFIKRYINDLNISFFKAMEILRSSNVLKGDPFLFAKLTFYTAKLKLKKQLSKR